VDKEGTKKERIVEIVDHEKNKSSIFAPNETTKRYFRRGWL
jgi:hypothetical protein